MGDVEKGERSWWKTLSVRRKWGGGLAAVGAVLTVALAFLGSKSEPPTASTQALIALLAILAQSGAAWAFSGEGKADPTLAQRSVARLFRLGQRAGQARVAAELLSVRGASVGDLREGMQQLSVHLSYLEEGFLDSIDDWRTFHSAAVEAAEEKSVDDE
jgi:hypothetical protein